MSETITAFPQPSVLRFAESLSRASDVRSEPSLTNLTLYRALAPDLAREGLRRLRLLHPDCARVFALKGEQHLAVVESYPRSSQELGSQQMAVISSVLSNKSLVLDRKDPGWILCLLLKDSKGCLRGLLYGESSSRSLDTEALEDFLVWTSAPQAAPLVGVRVHVEPFLGRIKTQSFVTTLTSLSVMTAAGLTLNRALRHLDQHSEDAQSAGLCRFLADQLESGSSLSRAASQFPHVFTPMHLGMLKVAEETGTMDSTLAQLALFEEKKMATCRRIQSALGYPLFLLVACFLALLLAPPFVLEGHFQLMRDLKIHAPLLTQALMDFSAFMRTPWPYLLLFAGGRGLWILWNSVARQPAKMLRASELALRAPKFGKLLNAFLTTRFARALSVQLEAGIRPTEALKTAGVATGNPMMERIGERAAKLIEEGHTFTSSLQETAFFSPLFVSIVHTGEQVGELGPLTRWLADNSEQELENTIDKVVSLIEPFVMVSMGLVVGVMALATLLPLSSALANI